MAYSTWDAGGGAGFGFSIPKTASPQNVWGTSSSQMKKVSTPKTKKTTVTKSTTPQQPQQVSSWKNQSVPSYGGGFNFKWPSMPSAPKVTQAMINEWIERAKNEAGLQYDPQVLSIQQELDKALLMGQQSKGALPQYYQDIMDYIGQWQTDETSAEQRRQYSRGFGRSGELLTQENKIAEQALKQGTAAQTEQARKLSDIDAQMTQMQEQAGQKIEGAETAKGQYVAARQAELRDNYVANQQALAQQKFQNQMAIQQFGLTAETQAFNQWLSQMEMANEINYQNQIMTLQQEAEQRAAQFNVGTGKTSGTGGITNTGMGINDYWSNQALGRSNMGSGEIIRNDGTKVNTASYQPTAWDWSKYSPYWSIQSAYRTDDTGIKPVR